MSLWDILWNLWVLAISILAGWKIHDIFFPSKPKYTMQDKISDDWAENMLVVRFFTEFIYKNTEKLDYYEPAPADLYDQLRLEFLFWAENQKK